MRTGLGLQDEDDMPAAQAAGDLLECLTLMGEKDSNPVLEILDGAEVIHQLEHYAPEESASRLETLRYYYHSHDYPGRQDAEHGHYHLFVPMDSGWDHLIGLSMDEMGQPLGWFSTNQWVTNSALIPVSRLRSVYDTLVTASPMLLVERYLIDMLYLYQDEIGGIYDERDRQLAILYGSREEKDVLKDRVIYQLSGTDIHLQDRLLQVLG